MTDVKPITPEELKKVEGDSIPSVVIESVNELLVEKARNGRATLRQNEVIERILQKAGLEITKSKLFDKGWLDFEPVFRRAGWDVEFDRPAYCETYEPNWTFKAKR
jgi:hypothetical protein